MIYLDNAATTFPKPETVYKAVDYVQRNLAVNIGRGSYTIANEAMIIADETRYLMAELVGIENPKRVVFTPSATIAANEIIYGIKWNENQTVYVSPFEHNAIARPLEYIRQKIGIKVIQLPFSNVTQELDIDRTNLLFSKNAPDYVFVSQISNVTGAILPVRLISDLAKKYDATIIVDASQSIGLLDINMQRDGINYLIFAGHKNIYASWGIGGFVCNDNRRSIYPVLSGGTGSNSLELTMGSDWPVSFEPGSPNIIAIASLNAALKWVKEISIHSIQQKKSQLVNSLIEGLKDCGAYLYLPRKKENHSSVISFNIDGYKAGEVGNILSQEFDIAVRAGYHCAPYIHEFLGTLSCEGTVRASVGYFNTIEDIETFLSAVEDL